MTRRRRVLTIAALSALAFTPALAHPGARELLRAAKERLAGREWPQASQELERLLREHKDGPEADQARLLRARARGLAGDQAGALAAADELLRATPASPLADQARYLRARALLALGREAEAAEALEERLLALGGEAHRTEQAALWLQLADAHWSDPAAPTGDPADPTGDPADPALDPAAERARALRGYENALRLGAPAARQAEVLLRAGLCLLEAGQPEAARERFAQLVKEAPRSPLAPRAAVEEGRALSDLGRTDDARAAWRALAAREPVTEQSPRALLLLARSYQGGAEALRLRVEQLEQLLTRFPADALAPEARLELAAAHVQAGRLDPAIAALRLLVQEHPEHPQADQASLQAAQLELALGRFEVARAALAAHLSRYPASPTFPPAQEGLALSWIEEGRQRLAQDDPQGALAAWNGFLERYPVHPQAAGVLVEIGQLHLDRARPEEALAAWTLAAERYPGSQEGAEAQLRLARTVESRLDDLPRATRALEVLVERFPGTWQAEEARGSLRRLREKHLRLLTASARPVEQGAAVQLATRNVAELQLKAYKLDLVEYFTRKQHVGRVEDLAIEVVKPDLAWAEPVPGYQPLRLFERELSLPNLKGPGAWVLTAEEETWKATTLVLVSDLTLIVKRAPGQVLACVFDQARSQPAPGVELLISDGSRIVARGKTGPDGTFLSEAPTLGSGTRILAHKDGQVAFDDGAPGPRGGFAWQTKVWAFTDRPVYRPGDTARWKAFCRRVADQAYAFQAGEEAQVSLIDARGVRRTQDRLPLSRLGSLSGQLPLGEEPPLGEWTLEVVYSGTTYRAPFHVEAYKKPEVVVEVRAATDGPEASGDVLAGETVAARVAVRTYFGSPVANAPVRWTLYRTPSAFDREAHQGFAWFKQVGRPPETPPEPEYLDQGELTTDAEGACQVSFPTAPLDRDMLYTLLVESRGQDQVPVAGGLNVFATTRAFQALVRSEARVVRPGAGFKALVETVDARHQGHAQRGELQVLRLIAAGEEVVQRLPVQTDAEGRQELTVTVARPGDYALRFVGADRRGGRVEGEDRLVVAGAAEGQAPQARLRADREVYRRGEKARVLLNGPAPGALALLTWEGEKVLRHRVLTLGERSQTLELELDDACSPNVFLRLAIPWEGQLLEDQDELLVFKFLELTVTPDKAEYGPGEQVQLLVEAKDQAGNPIQAEVALAVVDEAIFAIRPDATPGARPFFYDQRRQLAVTTGSSLDWRYEGVLRRQQEELLAEREERELEGKLAAADDLRRGAMRERAMAAPAAPPPPPGMQGAGGRGNQPMRKEGGARADKAMLADEPMPMAEEAMAANAEPAGGAARRLFADTALWAPEVLTGADGKGRVTFKLPDDLTRWRVTARGLSADTLAGDATAGFTSARDLVVRLALPRVVTEQDRWTKGLIVDQRRGTPATGQAGIELGGQKAQRALQLAPFSAQRLDWGPELAAPPLPLGPLTVRGWAEAGGARDALERTVQVVPAGYPERAARAGLLEGETTIELELPADVVPGSARLSVRVFPDGGAALLDGLAYLDAFPYGCAEQTVSRFLPLVAARELLEQSGLPRDDLRRRVREGLLRGVGRLLELQRPDGGWGWWSEDPVQGALTGYALLGLVRAAQAGAFVDPGALGRARQSAQRLLRQAGADQETRAVLCLALAAAGERGGLQDDLNRLARDRGALSLQALALTALARREAEGSAPGELLDALRERLSRLPAADAPAGDPRQGWGGAQAESLAWAGLALATGRPQADADLHARLVDWLRARQGGDGAWRSTRETAAVLLYLAARQLGAREALDLTVGVALDGAPLADLRLKALAAASERTLVVAPERLHAGKLALRLSRRGAGTPRYVAELSWVRRGLPADGAASPLLAVERRLLPGQGATRARAFPHLPAIVQAQGGVAQALDALTVGEQAWLEVELNARADLPFAAVEVPLPAGVELLRDRVEGRAPDRLEAWDDRLVLFWSALPAGRTTARFLVQAVTPGAFALRPASGWLMYAPEVQARSGAAKLSVSPEAGAGREPGPDEQLLRARALMDQQQWAPARALLEALLRLPLLDEPKAEVLERLFTLGVRLSDAALTVRSYEALVDLDPRFRELPAAARRDLALAYRRAGQPRRAAELTLQVLVLLFRDERTLVEAQREEGQALAAQGTLQALLLRYPDEEALVAEWLAMARAWLSIPRATVGGQAQPRHWRPDRPQDVRVEEAWEAFKDFCAWFPLDPRAAEAQFGAVEALALLGDDEGVAREAQSFARRYPRDARLDDALIVRLRALHRLARWEDAFATGRELLAWREPRGAGGRPQASPFTDEAIHTFARIHHQRGELAQAVEHYARVRGRIPDAQDAWTWLTQSQLELPDLVRAAPGAQVQLPVRSKNVDELALEVYPVDLMILFLTRKSLSGIQDIDLTGVTPRVRAKAALGSKSDYAWREGSIPLAIGEPGVYLVVGKTGDTLTSTIVVVSALELEVQRAQSRVRVYLRTREGAPAAGAKVRISDGQRLIARGTTDARGVCELEARVAPGRLSVLVERDGHYALSREQSR